MFLCKKKKNEIRFVNKSQICFCVKLKKCDFNFKKIRSVLIRGVQKTDERWKISVRFSVANSNTSNQSNQTEIY